jgi:hypothetical protein
MKYVEKSSGGALSGLERSEITASAASKASKNEVVAMTGKYSYNVKELADLLDVGETTLQNQIIPVIKSIMAEALDETFRTIADQKDRIEFLEDENRTLHERLTELELRIFPELRNEPAGRKSGMEMEMVDLESVLGIELLSEPQVAPENEPAATDTGRPISRQEISEMVDGLRKDGLTYRQIADHFNGQEIPTLSGKGRWNSERIGRLLNR